MTVAEAVKVPCREGEKLFLARDLVSAVDLVCAGSTAAMYCCRCPGKDATNEDAGAVIDLGSGRGILAIADGVGGLPNGEDAAGLALKHLAAAVAEVSPKATSLREVILDGLELGSRAILETATGSATTIVVAEIDGERIRSYHVGDSAALLVGQRGKVKHLTVAHSPVGYAEAAGMIDEREAMVHEERHMVSNLVGSADMEIEIGPLIRMAERDTLLLASDGLFDNLWFDEIVEGIRKGPLGEALKKLSSRALHRMQSDNGGHPGKPDDLSFVLYRRH